MTWKIDKSFDFCYGHRVWSQKLTEEFCEGGDTSCKCKHAHGHQGHVHVFLESDELNDSGMVSDFKHLGWLKNFLDDNLDHKFIVDMNDPAFEMITRGHLETNHKDYPDRVVFVMDDKVLPLQEIVVPETDTFVGYTIDVSDTDGFEHEVLEGYFIVNFVPTSENFSKWLFDLTNVKMARMGVKVTEVQWFETPKSRSTYTG